MVRPLDAAANRYVDLQSPSQTPPNSRSKWTNLGVFRPHPQVERPGNDPPRTLDIPLTFENVEHPDVMTSDGPMATQLAGLISDTSAASALPGT
jgi:hypothetical protein